MPDSSALKDNSRGIGGALGPFVDALLGAGEDAARRLRVAESILSAISRSQAVIEFEPDGTIVRANKNFCAAMGYEADEITGQHHRIFVDPGYAQSSDYQAFWRDLAAGEFKTAEFPRVGKNGREIWIQATYSPIIGERGDVIRVVKIASDITEQKRQNADYQGQIEAISKSQGVIEFDLDGTIRTANDVFLGVMGYALDEVKGRHHSMFAEPGVAESAEYKAFWDDLRAGEFKAGEFSRVGKGGAPVWIQATYNPILDASGKPFKVVKFATDRTQQVQDRMRRSESVADIDHGLAQISGELTTIREHLADMAGSATTSSDNVNAMAAAIEELSVSIGEISQQAGRATEVAGHAVTQNAASNEAVSSLSESAERIGDVVKLINDIASQTNLLALNATIEAARAGEAGKGFAVVASEVKNLANQTAKATEEISGYIQSVQEATRASVGAIDAVSGTIDEINGISTSISAAVEEQSAVTRDMSSGMRETADSVDSIANGAREVSDAMQNVESATHSLKQASEQIA